MTNLFSFLTNYSTGGTWSSITYPSTVPVITGGNVDFTALPTGTYVFRYTVTSSSCTKFTDVTIIKWKVTLNTNTYTCTSTLNVYSTTNLLNSLDVYVKDNSPYVYAKTQAIVSSTCNSDKILTLSNEDVSLISNCGKCYQQYTFDVSDGTYVKSMQVIDSLTNTYKTLNLKPDVTTYLNPTLPCSANVNSANLYYSNADPITFRVALKQLIKNALCVEYGISLNSGYEVDVITTGSSCTVRFLCKHNPSSIWVGAGRTGTLVFTSILDTTTTATSFTTTTSVPISDDNNCLQNITSTPFTVYYLDASSDYNKIVLTTSVYPVIGNVLSTPVTEVTCMHKRITATTGITCSNQIVNWYKDNSQYGEQLTDTHIVYENETGVFKAVVNCNGCVKDASITI